MLECTQFAPEVYEQRRNKLIATLKEHGHAHDLVLILGHPQPFGPNDDHALSDFQPADIANSNFQYYVGPSGIAASQCAAVVINAATGITKLFAMPNALSGDAYIENTVWNGGDALDPQYVANELGLEYAGSIEKFSFVDERSHFDAVFNYMPIIASDQLLYYSKKFKPLNMDNLDEGSSDEFRTMVANQRMIKSPEEIKLMEKEGDVTTAIHNLVMKKVLSGTLTSEQETYAFIMQQILKAGKVPSFPPIVTTRGAVLHNRQTRTQLFQDGDLLLLDFGTKDPISGVCADQTSTIPVSKEFLPKQREIYELVLDAHKAGKDACVLGKRFEIAHKAAAMKIVEGLLRLGLVHGGTPSELVAMGVHTLFLPHGLGHAIGLDTHDLGDQNEDVVGYPDIQRDKVNNPMHAVRFNRKLEVGHCFTIEPGIYFIPGLIEQWKHKGKFADYINREKVEEYAEEVSGIRYEECYYMSENGIEKLGTTNKFSSVEDIESL